MGAMRPAQNLADILGIRDIPGREQPNLGERIEPEIAVFEILLSSLKVRQDQIRLVEAFTPPTPTLRRQNWKTASTPAWSEAK